MHSIDIHAHSTPQSYLRAAAAGQNWHGMKSGEASGNPRNAWTPEERIADMDSLGVDVQVVSTAAAFYQYHRDSQAGAAIARECNDEVRQMTLDYPQRLAGFATLPMQDVPAAIAELERAVTRLGLKGAMIDDKVRGRTYDEPEFLPFWKAAEQMGAVIFVHQLGGDTSIKGRADRYHQPNTIGNLVDRTVTFASLVLGGVMDACPDLKVCLAHGGGYTCYAIGRIDRGWRTRAEAKGRASQPPSSYLRRFYYDSIVYDERALRFLIDSVGVDRVVLGTDWPADMCLDWPVSWVLGMESLTQEEKEAILYKNLEALLGL